MYSSQKSGRRCDSFLTEKVRHLKKNESAKAEKNILRRTLTPNSQMIGPDEPDNPLEGLSLILRLAIQSENLMVRSSVKSAERVPKSTK